jgi:hypothetical protein
MTVLSHRRSERLRLGHWWLGLLLASVLGFSGCKTPGLQDDGLRDNGLSASAQQFRSKVESADKKGSKAADDPWMSDKAQKIARDLQ